MNFHSKLPRWWFAAALAGLAGQVAAAPAPSAGQKYLEATRVFADTVLEHGRDRYGEKQTSLFVDGLHATKLVPARWQRQGESWVLCNFASQQPLLRALDGLTALTGEPKYRAAAEDAARYALAHLQSTNGLLYWGGHLAWDLEQDKAVGQYADVHELKNHQPYYRLMWRVNAPATRKLMESIWAGHVLDWELLDYNRHASTRKPLKPKWDHAFKEDVKVPFAIPGGNLSFVNVTPPLMHSGTMLAVLGQDSNALTWTRRLAWRWQQGRHPETGLCGGQLSYRRQDRAQEALGHAHPAINEAMIVASYHQTCRYHDLPLAQMQAGLSLVEAGGAMAEVGREFIRWAAEDLKTYARQCYDAQTGRFIARMTDGTPLQWEKARSGYYVPESFAPRKPDGELFWGYALAFRLTRDEAHWNMICELARQAGLGEFGQAGGKARALQMDTSHADWQSIYALLEIFQARRDRQWLQLAGRVADNLLETRSHTGLFPRAGREYARTGDEIPLALLHLAAALEDRAVLLPAPKLDHRFFHCEYDGPLEPHQEKRADSRTYDGLVFYGD